MKANNGQHVVELSYKGKSSGKLTINSNWYPDGG